MIELPVKFLRAGMVMAQGLYNSKGANYLSRGTVLTQKYIGKLRDVGVTGINVTSIDTASRVPPPEEILQEKTRAIAIKRVYDSFVHFRDAKRFEEEPLQKASAEIINDILTRRNNLVQMTDLRTHDLYTFAHSVNVSMICALIGVLIGLDKHRLEMLTMGALLHDLGKLNVPAEVLNKRGRLTDEEFRLIKKHPMDGWRMIQSLGVPGVREMGMVARFHHEHIDGTGYPEGRKGTAIGIFGRIGAIADVYDALTSARPYKKAYPPSVAYNIMHNLSRGQFDMELLERFFKNVAIYPVGTVIELSLGYAIVSSCNFGHTQRPVVILFAEKNGNLLKNPVTIDLSEEKDVTIDLVIKDIELYHFVKQMGFDPESLLADEKEEDEQSRSYARAL